MFITINDRFSCSRDTYGWTLTETQQKTRLKDQAPEGNRKGWKKGDKYTTTHQSYYSNLEQVCHAILDKSVDGCENADQIVYMLEQTAGEIKFVLNKVGMK